MAKLWYIDLVGIFFNTKALSIVIGHFTGLWDHAFGKLNCYGIIFLY